MMSGVLAGLEPRDVWRHFEALLSIPRPSGSEGAAADYITGVAAGLGLPWKRDEAGNVLVSRPGKGTGVVLQAHTDIVAEKLPHSAHDPLKDPVRPVLRDGWVMAEETTLGADNGMGVAIMLSVLGCSGRQLPPLECLFTVDEERGLLGARVFPVEWLSHRMLINLDSEEENSICIGCAGGRDIELTMGLERETAGMDCWLLTVDGLAGGHSGMEIGRGRANAIVAAARVCRRLGLRVAGFNGGSKHNAIPREASVVVCGTATVEGLADAQAELRLEYAGIDDSLCVRGQPCASRAPLTEACSTRLLDLLLGLPHGVRSMSAAVPGLVQTSSNLAIVRSLDDSMMVTLSTRSSVDTSRDALVESVRGIARLAGCTVKAGEGYPGWAPDPASPLLERAKQACTQVFGSPPSVVAIHAGLECGLIGTRVGGMDMISMGPDIRDVHVPGERVSAASVEAFHRMLLVLLEGLTR